MEIRPRFQNPRARGGRDRLGRLESGQGFGDLARVASVVLEDGGALAEGQGKVRVGGELDAAARVEGPPDGRAASSHHVDHGGGSCHRQKQATGFGDEGTVLEGQGQNFVRPHDTTSPVNGSK
jgi:hypothetical protein